jgi:hypothetical protein
MHCLSQKYGIIIENIDKPLWWPFQNAKMAVILLSPSSESCVA